MDISNSKNSSSLQNIKNIIVGNTMFYTALEKRVNGIYGFYKIIKNPKFNFETFGIYVLIITAFISIIELVFLLLCKKVPKQILIYFVLM